MVLINENYFKLQARYLFSDIAKKTKEFLTQNPDAPVIKLGIGDTTLPLSKSVIKAFHEGVEEMAQKETYQGYGPYQGFEFLLDAIIEHDFKPYGVEITREEIFVSDGSKCDTGNILDIFGQNIIAVTDPSYPVYVDTNVMAGNTGTAMENGQYEGLVYLECTEQTGFNPVLPTQKVDLIYLCSPNNPTGIAMNKAELTKWVNYAKDNNSIILFDAAYERYITEPEIPHSIFEIPGAKEVAIEFRSYSKTAGFTGTRCAYTVIPNEVMAVDQFGKAHKVRDLWFRRQSTKFNGVSYPVQKAAAAIYTPEGKQEVNEIIAYYQENSRIIREGLEAAGLQYFGGINSPYIWLKAPKGLSSWEFFDLLLEKLNVVGTPGSGFGPSGKGYFRLTSFGDRDQTLEAVNRIKSYDWN